MGGRSTTTAAAKSRDAGPPLQPKFMPGHGWARVDSGDAACDGSASPLLAAYAENAAHYGTTAVPATDDDAPTAARGWLAKSLIADSTPRPRESACTQ